MENIASTCWTPSRAWRRFFAAGARRNNIELACEIAPDLPARLRGDPNRLAQVLANFTSNARQIHATREVRDQGHRRAGDQEWPGTGAR